MDLPYHRTRISWSVAFAALLFHCQPVPPSPETREHAAQPASTAPLLEDVVASSYGPWPGALQVDRMGQATYALPLDLPAGRAGLTPELSFVYSTSAGDGALGVGWSIGVTSRIARCSKTPRTHGVRRGVRHDGDDAFCLDGVPLMPIVSSLPANELVLSPESDPRLRVVGHMTGVDRTAPDWDVTSFEIHYPDGRRGYLGRLHASRGLAHNGRTATWFLDRLVDTEGNYIQYDYAKNTRDPEIGSADSGHRLIAIQYGGNMGSTGAVIQVISRRVEFAYAAHPEGTLAFNQGYSIWTKHRLSQVKVFVDEQQTAAYKLSYEPSPHTGRSLLQSIQRCGYLQPGGTESCQAPNLFTYGGGNVGAGGLRTIPGDQLRTDGLGPLLADVDRDGRADLVYSRYAPSVNDTVIGQDIVFRPGLPPGSAEIFGGELVWTHFAEPVVGGLIADFDDNGSLDLMLNVPDRPNLGWRLLRMPAQLTFSTSTPGNTPLSITTVESDTTDFDRWVDVDGDGLTDGLFCRNVDLNPNDANGPSPIFLVRYNNGGGVFTGATIVAGPNTQAGHDVAFSCALDQPPLFVDLDADGALDVVFAGPTPSRASLTFATFANRMIRIEQVLSAGAIPGLADFWHARPADYNGDGLDDLTWYAPVRSTIGLELLVLPGTGDPRTLFASEPIRVGHMPSNTATLPDPAGLEAAAMDLDGDGRADFFEYDNDHFTVAFARRILSGIPDAYSPEVDLLLDHSRQSPLIGDIDGNGMTDIVWPMALGGIQVFQQSVRRPDQLLKIHEGVDESIASIELTYGVLSDSAVYSRDSACVEQSDTLCIHGSQASVIRTVALDAGPGHSPHTSHYTYVNGRRERGTSRWLGFERMVVTEDRTGRIATTEFDLTTRTSNGRLTRLGQVVAHTVRTPVDGRWHIEQETRGYATLDVGTYGFITYLDRVSRSVREQVDPDRCSGHECRALEASEYRVTTVDALGYPRQVDETRSGEVVRTTSREYFPHESGTTWLMGRTRHEWVTDTILGGMSEVRHRRFTYRAGSTKVSTHTVGEDGDRRQLVTTFDYDAYGNNISTCARDVVRNEIRCTTIAYDATGLLPISTTNPLGHTTLTVLHPVFGVPRRIVDPNGEIHDFQFDTRGRMVKAVAPDGSATLHGYQAGSGDNAGLLTSQAPGAPMVTTAVDRLGRARSRSWPSYSGVRTHVVQQEYDAAGRTSLVRGPYLDGSDPSMAPPTLMAYDALDRPTLETRPLGGEVRWTYEPGLGVDDPRRPTLGRRVIRRDPNGHERVVDTDGLGRVERVVDARGGTTTYRYGPFGVMRSSVDALQRETSWEYDAYGAREALVDPVLGRQSFESDAFGHLRTVIEASTGLVTRLEYDSLGRRTRRIAGSELSTWSYDLPPGCSATACGAAAHTIGRLVGAEGADGDSTRYTFDEFGRPTTEGRRIAGALYEYEYAYDGYGRLERLTYPRAADNWRFAVKYEYAQGQLSRLSNADNDATLWAKTLTDAAGRTREVSFGNNLTSSWTYDAEGRVRTTRTGAAGQNALAEMAYDHDLAGNVIARRDLRQSMSEHLVYDELDRLSSNCFESGAAVVPPPSPASESALERLAGAVPPTYAPGLPGVAMGTPPGATGPSELGKWDSYARSPLTAPEQVAIALSSGMPMAGAGVLGAETSYRRCTSYAYDAGGNFEWREGVGAYVYPAKTPSGREIHAPGLIVHPSGSTALSYDDAGRSVRIGGTDYKYTALGWLRSSQISSGLRAQTGPLGTTFRYDADGRRTQKISNLGTVTYAGALFEERMGSGSAPAALTFASPVREARVTVVAEGAAIAEIVHHVGRLEVKAFDAGRQPWVGTGEHPPSLSLGALDAVRGAATGNTNTIVYLHADPQGTTEMVTDAGKYPRAGQVVERRSYEPFGRSRSPDWSAGYALPAVGRRWNGFTGHVEDEETGLVDMVGRQYAPHIGRFLTPDPMVQAPLNSQSHNRYAYVWNNPVTNVDPTGFNTARIQYTFAPTFILAVRRPRFPLLPADDGATAGQPPVVQPPPPEEPATAEPTSGDTAWRERPRLIDPNGLIRLYRSYREYVHKLNRHVGDGAHRIADGVHDATGSDATAATVATVLQVGAGVPVGLLGLGLLPEQLVDSVDDADKGLEMLADGIEQDDPYRAWMGVAQLSGVAGMWAGTAAGAAGVIKGRAPGAGGGGARPLTPADLGLRESTQVEGTLSMRGGKVTAKVDYLGAPAGETLTVGELRGMDVALRGTAAAEGGSVLRVETSPVIQQSARGVPVLRRLLERAGFESRPNGTMWRETPL